MKASGLDPVPVLDDTLEELDLQPATALRLRIIVERRVAPHELEHTERRAQILERIAERDVARDGVTLLVPFVVKLVDVAIGHIHAEGIGEDTKQHPFARAGVRHADVRADKEGCLFMIGKTSGIQYTLGSFSCHRLERVRRQEKQAS